MKQIAHRIHEDRLWRGPLERLRELFVHKPQVEPLLIGVSGDTTEALGKCFGIAVLAAWADLCTASYRVPRRIRPFNRGFLRHHGSLRYLRNMSPTIFAPVLLGEAKYR